MKNTLLGTRVLVTSNLRQGIHDLSILNTGTVLRLGYEDMEVMVKRCKILVYTAAKRRFS
jgi:hypothetical protein